MIPDYRAGEWLMVIPTDELFFFLAKTKAGREENGWVDLEFEKQDLVEHGHWLVKGKKEAFSKQASFTEGQLRKLVVFL